MGKFKDLSSDEKALILSLLKAGISQVKLAVQMGRSQSEFGWVIKNKASKRGNCDLKPSTTEHELSTETVFPIL